MQSLQSLPWVEPLELAAGLTEGGVDSHWALLYSGTKTSYSGRFSYLAYELKELVSGDSFSVLAGKLTDNRARLDNAWFGYLGYGLKDGLEELVKDSPNWLKVPHLCMMQFANIIIFDHVDKSVTVWSDNANPRIPEASAAKPIYPAGVTGISSNMTKQNYLEKVSYIVERIYAGDLYQANLTRKFMGNFKEAPAPFAIFRKLCFSKPGALQRIYPHGRHLHTFIKPGIVPEYR